MRGWEMMEMCSLWEKLDLEECCIGIISCGGSCKIFVWFLVVLLILVFFGVFFYLNGIVIVGGEVLCCLFGVYNGEFDIFILYFVVVGVLRLMWVFFLWMLYCVLEIC